MKTASINAWHRKILSMVLWFCMSILVCIVSSRTVVGGENHNFYFETLQKRLIKDGFDSRTITELYSHPKVYFEKKGVTLFLSHREAKLNYNQFVSSRMLKKARQYMKTHESVLRETEKNYGVDKEVITAIILVETRTVYIEYPVDHGGPVKPCRQGKVLGGAFTFKTG